MRGNNSKRKTIILLFLIIVTVLSATYAYSLISASNNTATIYIHTDTSTTAPIDETEALKYNVLSGNDIISEGLINTIGDLAIATVSLTTTSTTYDIYVWVDSEISQGLFNETTYSGYIYAIADQTSTIKQINALADQYMVPNAINDSDLDFSETSEESNTNGIYLRNDTQNDTYPIYYYRGDVDNNLIFANFCWKIVRTTETGGLKLIYNGVPSDGKCNNTGDATTIGTMRLYNGSDDSLSGIGYMYGTRYTYSSKSLSSTYVYGNDVSYSDGTYTLTDTTTQSSYSTTLNNYHYTCFSSTGTTCTSVYYIYYVSSSTGYYITLSNGKKVEDSLSAMLDNNTTSSTIKGSSTTSGTLDYWYYTNIEQKGYSNYIEDTIWCNDRSIYQLNGWNPDGGSLTGYLYFLAYNRAVNTYQPNLTCSIPIDRFTVDDFNGNGNLTYPVGLLTADEVMLAGGKNDTANSTFYLNGSSINIWTMSPSYIDEYGGNSYSFSGSQSLYDMWQGNWRTRPSISLTSGFSLTGSGTGTGDNPYIVE